MTKDRSYIFYEMLHPIWLPPKNPKKDLSQIEIASRIQNYFVKILQFHGFLSDSSLHLYYREVGPFASTD